MKLRHLAAAGTLALLAALPTQAAVVTLDFEGIGNLAQVGNYYNGGAGTNYGIGFTPGSLAIIDADAGGTGNIGNEPSPNTVLFFLTTQAAIMNVSAGFSTGFSFFYSSVNSPGSVDVFDDLNGTGNLLATLVLPALGAGPGDPNGQFSNWKAIGVLFGGTAKSVSFGGSANFIAFDNVTFGTDKPGGGGPAPIPVPAAGFLMLGALGALGALRRRNRA
jgi:hypothetical protein